MVIGMLFIFEDVAIGWKGPGYTAVPSLLPTGHVFSVAGITFPVLLLLVWFVKKTRQGKAMRATAQDRDAAAMMGIDVNRTISFTFLIADALAGPGGTVYAIHFRQIHYDTGF